MNDDDKQKKSFRDLYKLQSSDNKYKNNHYHEENRMKYDSTKSRENYDNSYRKYNSNSRDNRSSKNYSNDKYHNDYDRRYEDSNKHYSNSNNYNNKYKDNNSYPHNPRRNSNPKYYNDFRNSSNNFNDSSNINYSNNNLNNKDFNSKSYYFKGTSEETSKSKNEDFNKTSTTANTHNIQNEKEIKDSLKYPIKEISNIEEIEYLNNLNEKANIKSKNNDEKANDNVKKQNYDNVNDSQRRLELKNNFYNQRLFEKLEFEEADKELERDWYNQDDNECISMPEMSAFKNYIGGITNNTNGKTQQEIEKLKISNPISNRTNNNRDANKWEIMQLINSGIIKEEHNDNDEIEDEEKRIIIQAHEVKLPPFIENYNKVVSQIGLNVSSYDSGNDMIKNAKKGSELIKEIRERNERTKAQERFWEASGKKIGEVTGETKLQDNEMIKETNTEENIPDNTKKENTDLSGKFNKAHFSSSLISNNESSHQSYFSKHKSIKEQREYLPIYSVKKELMRVIRDNKIIVIVGETGSGKTTQLTQYLYEENFAQLGIIGCTQPRRVAAVSVAKRVSEEMGVDLGTSVGYSIRFEDCTSNQTKIKYMTDGVLLRESLNDSFLDDYSVIIMDEAHERSLNTDVLFGILKKVLAERKDLKLIVTSATMNAQKFSEFFGFAPIFNIPGRTFKVDIIYNKILPDDYVEASVQKALTVHLQYGDGDILIFMTGQEDIEATCLLLNQRIEKDQNIPKMLIIPIYSQLPSDLQAKIFEPSKFRKCIVATNIAETSLTLDGVKYVIDSGFFKVKVYSPRIGMDVLQINPISRANANQRSGRAGRTGPGVCFRMYTESNFRSDMSENNIPEIQRTNLSNVVLLLKSLKIDNLLSFNFMDPPSSDTILSSMHHLWMLGALNSLGDLTDLGKKMVEFPLDPSMSKVLILSDKYSCSEEILIILAMLSVPSIFYRPKNREQEADKAKEKFFIPESDHLTLLNIYLQWKSNDFSPEWSKINFIQNKSLIKVKEVKQQLYDIMRQLKMNLVSCGNNWDSIRKCLACGFFHNSAKLKGLGEYVNIKFNIPCVLHPSSAIFTLGYTPDYVVYHELIMTNKEYMSCVTVIEPEWLVEVAPLFFSIKDMNIEDRIKNEKNREKLMNIEMKMRDILEKKREQTKSKDIYSIPVSKTKSRYKEIINAGSSTGVPKSSFGGYSTIGGKTKNRTGYSVYKGKIDLSLNEDKEEDNSR